MHDQQLAYKYRKSELDIYFVEPPLNFEYDEHSEFCVFVFYLNCLMMMMIVVVVTVVKMLMMIIKMMKKRFRCQHLSGHHSNLVMTKTN